MEWVRDVIVHSKVYFPPSGTFNDPFDCNIPFDLSSSDLCIQNYWRKFLKKDSPSLDRKLKRKKVADLLHSSRTDEGRAELHRRVYEGMQRCGILCLSEARNSMLMWSYYASGHTGVAIEFDVTARSLLEFHQEFTCIKVGYCTEFPSIKFYETKTVDQISRSLGTKALDWAHEREWRIVLIERKGLISVPPRMIKSVIFGLRTPETTRVSIRKWASERSKPMSVYKIVNGLHNLDLRVVPDDAQ
jgi:hypothetical protein